MSSKLQITLMVFGAVALLFFFQYVGTLMTEEKKRERFLESFEEMPNEPEKPSVPSVPKTPIDVDVKAAKEKEIKMNVLDALDQAISEDPAAKKLKEKKSDIYAELTKEERIKEFQTSMSLQDDVKKYLKDYQTSQGEDFMKVDMSSTIPGQERKSESFQTLDTLKLAHLSDSLNHAIMSIQDVLSNIDPLAGSKPIAEATQVDILKKTADTVKSVMSGKSKEGYENAPTTKSPREDEGVLGFENIRSFALY